MVVGRRAVDDEIDFRRPPVSFGVISEDQKEHGVMEQMLNGEAVRVVSTENRMEQKNLLLLQLLLLQ